MTKTLCRLVVLAVVVWTLGVSSVFAQGASLHGKWVRDAEAATMIHGVGPEWEDVAVDSTDVKVTPEGRALGRITRVPDGVERADAINPRKYCRSSWDGPRLVTECRDMSGGPGGVAPPLYVREVRWVDAANAMVVETTWQSGERSLTLTSKYRKVEQQ